MALQHVFGPVPSRRLGRSLGINPIPFKTCTYNCVYCQLGRTDRLSIRRDDYLDTAALRAEIDQAAVQKRGEVDYVTFVGEGEPTLCGGLGELIRHSQDVMGKPVAVITNGSLLFRNQVRADVAPAQVVMPSLDAATPQTWKRVNRPHGRLALDAVIEGVVQFRQEFTGQLWLEVMLVAGLSDTEAELTALRQALDRMAPDRVYINVPVRPPAESWVEPPGAEGMVRAHAILGDGVFIDFAEEGEFDTAGFEDPLTAVMTIVRRHPMRMDQIQATLSQFSADALKAALDAQVAAGQLRRVEYRGASYYTTGGARFFSKE